MIPYPRLILVILILGLFACNRKADQRQLITLDGVLKRSNHFIENSNLSQYWDIAKKQADPSTAYSAGYWSPVANKIRTLSHEAEDYVDTIERKTSANHSWEPELFNKLVVYRKSLFSIFNPDSLPGSPDYLKADLDSLDLHLPLKRLKGERAWADTMFSNDSLSATIALDKIKNDLLLSENMAVRICVIQIAATLGGYEVPHLEAYLSSSYVKRGQMIDVTAGVIICSMRPAPQISINGVRISLNHQNLGQYTIKATGPAGKHKVIVSGFYYKPDGSISQCTRELEYIVAE